MSAAQGTPIWAGSARQLGLQRRGQRLGVALVELHQDRPRHRVLLRQLDQEVGQPAGLGDWRSICPTTMEGPGYDVQNESLQF